MRLVVLGGSGASTPELIEALAHWPGGAARRPELAVVLVGRSAEKLELVARACRARAASGDGGAGIEILTHTDRRHALHGADVVLNQVRVGGLDARSFDESFPWAFELPGEETMGPGGFANALRTVPVVVAGLRDVADIAPGALVVNLTNPAGIVQAAALRTTSLRVLEVCDSPLMLLDAVACRVGRPIEEVRARYVGMNHLGWYVPESARELDNIVDLATGMDPDAVRLHQALPQPYVRYYLHADRLLAAQRGRETRAQALRRLEAGQLEAYASGAAAEAPRRGAVWYSKAVVPLLDGWLNGSPAPLIVGVRNDRDLDGMRGATPIVPGLPADVVVEVPVTFPAPRRLDVLDSPALPAVPRALLAAHASYEWLTVNALVGGGSPAGVHEREPLLRALVANPMVRTFDQAVGLLDAILTGSPA